MVRTRSGGNRKSTGQCCTFKWTVQYFSEKLFDDGAPAVYNLYTNNSLG